jgi:2-(1,2-epoxy-1,2-dihydrophenyl)acetyl-CoA isomerase
MIENPTESLVSDGVALLDLEGSVARLQLNRADSANGLDIDMLVALHRALVLCHGDPRIRVVLLTGKGANFCAGGDVRMFASKGESLPYYIRQATHYLQIVIGAMIQLHAPIVVAVQGFAAGGGGMGLVCAADLVIAGESAKFLAAATRVGMAPDAGLSVTLPRLIGTRKATEMLLLNTTVAASEALMLGLVNRVVPDAELAAAAMAYAVELASGAPQALAATKRLLWTGAGLGVEAAMPEESRTVADLCRTDDVREGLAAVMEKRAARFSGQ